MRRIARLLRLADVPKREHVQAVAVMDPDARHGEEHGPRDEPDRNEDFDHHAEEAHEEVRVEPILEPDGPVVGFEQSDRPGEELVWEGGRRAPAGEWD